MFIVCLRIKPFKKCYFDLIVWCLLLSHLRRRTTRTRLKAGSLSLPRCTRTESRSLARPTTQFSSFTTNSLRGLQWLYPSHVSQSSQQPHYLSYHYIHKLFFLQLQSPQWSKCLQRTQPCWSFTRLWLSANITPTHPSWILSDGKDYIHMICQHCYTRSGRPSECESGWLFSSSSCIGSQAGTCNF